MSALVLLSGGLDSTVAAALARADGLDPRLAFFVDYGQRAVDAERRAARAVSEALQLRWSSTTLGLLAEVGRTALVDPGAELPEPSPDDLDSGAAASADAVWVPNRNGVLIHLAAAVAEAEGLDTVVVGFNAEEAASFPDNSAGFLEALNASLAYSTRGAVTVAAPTLAMSKAEVLAAGLAVGAPVEASWSCYAGGERPCRRCESCLRRARAEALVAAGS